MPTRDWALAAVLALAGVVTRLPLRARLLPTWDAVQFALALREFDVSKHQPHPPGYILYVGLGRAVLTVLGDPVASLAALSALAGGVTLVLLYRLAFALYDRATAVLATAGLLVSPLFWFYGLVGLSYAAEAALATLVALAIWPVARGDRRGHTRSAVALALAGGVRQSILPLLLPLWLIMDWRAAGRWRGAGLGLVVMAATSLMWVVPLLVLSGGPVAYLAASVELFDSTVRGTTILTGRWVPNVERLAEAALLGFGLFLPLLGVVATVSLWRPRAWGPRAWLLAGWVVPPLLTYALVHVGQYGYLLIVLPAGYLVVARGLLGLRLRLERIMPLAAHPLALALLWVVVLAIHAGVVLAAPALDVRFPDDRGASTAATWRQTLFSRYRFGLWTHTVPGLRDTEAVIATYVEAVRRRFPSGSTLLVTEVGNPRSFPWFRHVGYYLPEYPALHLRVGSLSRGSIVLVGERGVMAARSDADILLPVAVHRLVWVVDHWAPGVPQPPGLEAISIDRGRFLYVLDLDRRPVEHAGYRLSPVTAVARAR